VNNKIEIETFNAYMYCCRSQHVLFRSPDR